jgi:hypothetical protein
LDPASLRKILPRNREIYAALVGDNPLKKTEKALASL